LVSRRSAGIFDVGCGSEIGCAAGDESNFSVAGTVDVAVVRVDQTDLHAVEGVFEHVDQRSIAAPFHEGFIGDREDAEEFGGVEFGIDDFSAANIVCRVDFVEVGCDAGAANGTNVVDDAESEGFVLLLGGDLFFADLVDQGVGHCEFIAESFCVLQLHEVLDCGPKVEAIHLDVACGYVVVWHFCGLLGMDFYYCIPEIFPLSPANASLVLRMGFGFSGFGTPGTAGLSFPDMEGGGVCPNGPC